MVPVALSSSVWLMARQWLRVLIGLATTALALTLLAHGAAATAAPQPTPHPMRPAVVQLSPQTDRPAGASTADHQLVAIEDTGPVLVPPRQSDVTRPTSPPSDASHLGPLGQRAPPRA